MTFRRSQIFQTILIIIIFIAIFSLAVIFLKQRTATPAEYEFVPPSELIESVKEISTPEYEKVPQQVRREGVSAYEKPFASGNYVYDERTADFRLVCARPCPVSKKVLDQEFAAIDYAVSTLRGLTQSNIHQSSMPFEVHASEDSTCPIFSEEALAYAKTFVDANGHQRGLLCFFFDKRLYDRSRFPYSTSVHEVTHLFQHRRLPPLTSAAVRALWEGMAEVLHSFFLKGNIKDSFCWQGNDWSKDIISNPHDPHNIGRQLFFELCDQYGFDYDDLPELFRRMDAKGRAVTTPEFVQIINDITGKNTNHVFRAVGLNV